MNALRAIAVLSTFLASPASATAPLPRALSSPHVIFLNRQGGTYTPGAVENSSQNVSSIPSGQATVPAFAGDDAAWLLLLNCVRLLFAPFDVTVTDVDPGNTAHLEAVIGGLSQNLGLQSGLGGISPLAPDCGPIDRSVVFAFAALYPDDSEGLCAVTASQIGHSLGLDTEYYCPDVTSYLTGCGGKSFQDHDAPCGEMAARTCACGASTQNSAQILLGVLGSFCATADCDDADACTTDTCDPIGRCGSGHLAGIPGVDCELNKLLASDVCGTDSLGSRAGVVTRAVGKARRLLAQASAAPKPGRAKKRVAAVQRTLKGLQGTLDRAGKRGKLTPGCGAIFDHALTTQQTVLSGLPL